MAAEASLGKTLCLLVTGCAVGSLFVYAIDGRVQVLTLPKTSSSLSNAFAFLSGMKTRRACTIVRPQRRMGCADLPYRCLADTSPAYDAA